MTVADGGSVVAGASPGAPGELPAATVVGAAVPLTAAPLSDPRTVVDAAVVVGADVLVALAAGSAWAPASVPSAVESPPQPDAKNANATMVTRNERKRMKRFMRRSHRPRRND